MRWAVLSAVLSWGLTACSGKPKDGPELLRDPFFRAWCDGAPCEWDVEDGPLEPAPTWHGGDLGLALVNHWAAVSQLLWQHELSFNCLTLVLRASADARAGLNLEIDFLDDGLTDHVQPLAAQRFEREAIELCFPPSYRVARLRLRRSGEGPVILAQFSAQRSSSSHGPKLVAWNLPSGGLCTNDAQCRSDAPRCAEVPYSNLTRRRCGRCRGDEDCSAGQICGLAAGGELGPEPACAEAGEDEMGAWCRQDAECRSGICCLGVCSICCDQGTCPEGTRCGTHRNWIFGPFRCGADSGALAQGSFCFMDADCASGACDRERVEGLCSGTLEPCAPGSTCSTGRACLEWGGPGTCR